MGKENIMKHAADLHEGRGAYQCQYCHKVCIEPIPQNIFPGALYLTIYLRTITSLFPLPVFPEIKLFRDAPDLRMFI